MVAVRRVSRRQGNRILSSQDFAQVIFTPTGFDMFGFDPTSGAGFLFEHIASLKSWRERKKQGDPDAHPPRKRKRYFRIEYKRSAMVLKEGKLRLSNGKDTEPLVLDWQWDLPNTVVIHWTGKHYEAIATYEQETAIPIEAGEVAGIDLGEVHMAVSHDGEQTYILNGRYLRSKVQ